METYKENCRACMLKHFAIFCCQANKEHSNLNDGKNVFLKRFCTEAKHTVLTHMYTYIYTSGLLSLTKTIENIYNLNKNEIKCKY